MADFVSIKDQHEARVWINLDYVVRIDQGQEPEESTSIKFADGSVLAIPRGEGKKLFKQLQKGGKKKEKKKKAAEATAETDSVPPGEQGTA